MGPVPSYAEIIARALESKIGDVYTVDIGRVEKYTRATQKADVQPVIKRAVPRADGTFLHETLPIIPSVPVLFPGSGPVAFVWDLEPGDHVLLLITRLTIAQWQQTGQISEAGDLRHHALGNAVALPVLVRPNSQAITIVQEGKLVIDGPEILLGAMATQLIARADRVETELQAIQAQLTSHKHSGVTAGAGTSGPSDSSYSAGSVGCDKVYGE